MTLIVGPMESRFPPGITDRKAKTQRMGNIRVLGALVGLLIASIAGSAAALNGPPVPDLKAAWALGQEMFLSSGSTGMVLVVVRGDRVFFQGYGETAPGSGPAPDAESVVRLCSLTKIFTTDLLTKLVAEKAVRLDDTLQRYAPARAVVPKLVEPITLGELAMHTSGLPREVGSGPRGTPHFTFPDYKTRWRWLSSQHLRSVPGTAALYSNVGYDLLSDALESATHKQFARLLSERTLKPLHMNETTYFPSAAQCGRLMASVGDEGPCTVTENTAGSSGLYSTSNDMAIWLKYLLGTGGPGFPAQAAAAQATYLGPSQLVNVKGLDHAGTPTGIGLGWMHLLAANDQSHIVEKTGGGAGFTSYIAINHARRTAVFVAATDGPGGWQYNLFKGANNLLLTMAGLPVLPEDPPKVAVRAHRRVAVRKAHRRRVP